MPNGAYINIEPAADGQINLSVVYQGGFDESNDSHLTARHLLGYMDSIAQRIGEPVHTPMPDAETIADVKRHQAEVHGVDVDSI